MLKTSSPKPDETWRWPVTDRSTTILAPATTRSGKVFVHPASRASRLVVRMAFAWSDRSARLHRTWSALAVALICCVCPVFLGCEPVPPSADRLDSLVLARLNKLKIPPATVCSDSEFVRRVYLEGAGLREVAINFVPMLAVAGITLPTAAWLFRNRLS